LKGEEFMENNMKLSTDLIQESPWPIAGNPLIIGEIGINHNGDINIAKELINMAHNCGFGAVKFQKRTIVTL